MIHKLITKIAANGVYPFHMPGHKRNKDFIPFDLLRLDLTEIPGLDVLGDSIGALGKLQKRIGEIYHADKSFLLVNGSSSGILAAILGTNRKNMFIPRNAHISVYNALALSDAAPHYYMPVLKNGIFTGVSPETFNLMPDNAVALIVSPTYQGIVSDIKKIAEIVHAKNGILIVDEAHGAHFPFHEGFPSPAITLDADIVVNSLHKTLPFLSQTASLSIKSKNVDHEKIKFYVNSFQTTSPSYIIMSVCDFMTEKLLAQPKLFTDYVNRLNKFRSNFKNGTVSLYKENDFLYDIGKLFFTVSEPGCGDEISNILLRKFKLQVEMSDSGSLLAMTSVADTDEGFERLDHALQAVNKMDMNSASKQDDYSPRPFPEVCMSIKEAVRAEYVYVKASEAVGNIAAEFITKIPPGIVLVAPGEKITSSHEINKEFVKVVKNI